MRTLRAASIVATLAFFAACAEDVGKGKAEAVVADVPTAPAEVAAPAAPAPAADVKVLTVDAARSKLGAVGAKVTAHHPIDLKAYTASVELSGDQVVGLSYEADMTTLESDHPKLTEHLKDADFFDVAKFPKSTFKAVTFAPGATGEGAEGMTHTVVGDLTIRGTTKRVTFPAKIEVKPEAVEATTEFSVNRQDFGIVYAGKADDLIQDKVVIKVQFVAPRGA